MDKDSIVSKHNKRRQDRNAVIIFEIYKKPKKIMEYFLSSAKHSYYLLLFGNSSVQVQRQASNSSHATSLSEASLQSDTFLYLSPSLYKIPTSSILQIKEKSKNIITTAVGLGSEGDFIEASCTSHVSRARVTAALSILW
jgi:hypothetical protein